MVADPPPWPQRLASAVLAATIVAMTSAGVAVAGPGDAAGPPDPDDDFIIPTPDDVLAPPGDPNGSGPPADDPDGGSVSDDDLPLLAGPVISIERQELRPGEEIIVTLAGFDARFVNVAVCGNEARRGSGDCNMQSAKGREIEPDELTTQTRFRVAAPPTPCPCIIRAASNGQSEVAIVPITLVDHPVAEPVDPPEVGPLVEATISVSKADANPFERLRTALGGTTTYDVFVTARNPLTTALVDLTAAATVGRGEDDDLALIDLAPIPRLLNAGQRWQQVVQVDLPRPVWGEAEWRLVVSGAGRGVEATTTTSNTPTALYVLIAVLVLDIAYILYRMRRRKRKPRRAGNESTAGPVIDIDDDGTVWTLDDEPEPRDGTVWTLDDEPEPGDRDRDRQEIGT